MKTMETKERWQELEEQRQDSMKKVAYGSLGVYSGTKALDWKARVDTSNPYVIQDEQGNVEIQKVENSGDEYEQAKKEKPGLWQGKVTSVFTPKAKQGVEQKPVRIEMFVNSKWLNFEKTESGGSGFYYRIYVGDKEVATGDEKAGHMHVSWTGTGTQEEKLTLAVIDGNNKIGARLDQMRKIIKAHPDKLLDKRIEDETSKVRELISGI